MDIIQVITQELKVEKWQVEAAVKLIDEGNTIPFISRYRKEATGSLNDEQLRALFERLMYLRNLEDKKNQVLKSIEDQGKLSGCPDTGCSRGLIQTISPETSYPCDNCQRERAGTTGRYHSSADDRQAGRRGSQGVCLRRKGC